MDKIKIELLRSNEAVEASVLLSRAFSPLPLPCAVFGNPSEVQRGFLKAGFRNLLENAPGKVLLAKENDQIIGVMRIVEWPDCQKSTVQVQKLLPEQIVLRMDKWRSIWAEHDPRKHHWHIDPIGVLPEKQGQGVGSSLLEHFCGYVDKLNQAAYLETDVSRNVSLYNRFGFNVVGDAPVLAVPNWFMWRPSPRE